MEKMVARYGVTVATQRHLHLRRYLAGNLAGAVEEVEQEALEAGGTSQLGTSQLGTSQLGTSQLGTSQVGTSQVGTGGSRALRRPREAGTPPPLLPRTQRLVLGTEL